MKFLGISGVAKQITKDNIKPHIEIAKINRFCLMKKIFPLKGRLYYECW